MSPEGDGVCGTLLATATPGQLAGLGMSPAAVIPDAGPLEPPAGYPPLRVEAQP